jgi:hypothetical protein
MPQTHEFIYRTVQHTLTRWYRDKDNEIMASNTTISERIPEHGEPPPGFHRFMGNGVVDVDTVLGPQSIRYGIPIPGATCIQEAAAKIDTADEAIIPEVVKAAKEQAKEDYDKIHSQLALPPGMRPPPGARGPGGLVMPGG